MRRTIRLTERDLTRLVKRVMNESVIFDELKGFYDRCGFKHLPTPSSNKIADDIYDSIAYQSPKSALDNIRQVVTFGASGIGTDKEKLIGAFKKMKTFSEFCSTKVSYFRIYKSDMLNDIDGDVDSDDIWKELSREKLIKFLNRVHMKLHKLYGEYKKANSEKIQEDESFSILCDKTSLKMMSIDFRQETILGKIRTNMYGRMKTDMKALVEYEFEF